MIAHVIHLGDTHGRLDARSDDQLRALDAAIVYGGSRDDLAAWLYPGDLFHTITEPETRNALQIRIQRMAELAPVIIVRGNHDLPGELDVFARLASTWPIRVSQTPEWLRVETPLLKPATDPRDVATQIALVVFTMPYPNTAALVNAGTPIDQISAAAMAALDTMLMVAADQFAREAYAIKLFAGHANVAGAVSSVGQPQIGNDIELSTAILDRLPADVHVAMNHIHKHQVVGRAVFAGSICRMNFGELEPKGIIDIQFAVQPDEIRYVGWEFVPIDVPAMYHIEGQLTPLGFTYRIARGVSDGTAALMSLTEIGRAAITSGAVVAAPATWKGSDVRVRYTYQRAEASVLNVAHIHAEFAEARSLKIEAVPLQEHEIRAPEVVAAPTVFEKLEQFAGRHGLAWSPALAKKAAALDLQPCEAWRDEALSRVEAIGADVIPE